MPFIKDCERVLKKCEFYLECCCCLLLLLCSCCCCCCYCSVARLNTLGLTGTRSCSLANTLHKLKELRVWLFPIAPPHGQWLFPIAPPHGQWLFPIAPLHGQWLFPIAPPHGQWLFPIAPPHGQPMSSCWKNCVCDCFLLPCPMASPCRLQRTGLHFLEGGRCYAWNLSWLKIVPRETTQRITTF